MSQGEYQLGHDPAELDRLNEQGGLLAPATTMLLQAAGIGPGIEQSLGARLWQVLSDAGVRPAGMLGVQPHYGPDNPGGSALLGGIVRTLAPVMERTGVATAEEVGPDTVVGRVARELAAHQAVFAHPMLMSAWGTV